jgi:hypothetical protein
MNVSQSVPSNVSCRSRIVPLHKAHPALLAKHKVAPQRIHNHKHQLVERRRGRRLPLLPQLRLETQLLVHREPGHEWLVRKKPRREDEDRNGDEEVREREHQRSRRHDEAV